MTRRKLLAGGAVCASGLWARSRWDRSRIAAITDEIGNTPGQAVDFAHEFGLQYLEIRNQPGSNKEYAALREADVQADATHIVNERIKVCCVNTSLLKFAWPGSDAPEAAPDKARWERRMDDLRKALRCAQLVGADKLRIFAGTRESNPPAALQRTAETVGEMALEAEKQKISLLVENDPATNIATSAEMAALMNLLPSKWVAIAWNPRNGRGLEQPFPAGYALLPKKRILHVRAQARGLMPGSTDTEDWRAILLALDHDGYNGKIALQTGLFDSTRTAVARASMDQLAHIVREVS